MNVAEVITQVAAFVVIMVTSCTLAESCHDARPRAGFMIQAGLTATRNEITHLP